MPWQDQYPGQPWREEPSGISKADKKLRDDKDAMMEMGEKKGGRFELKKLAKRLSINVDGCVNIEDFVNRIDMASRYPEVFDSM
jgi:hypothetical protein